MDNRETFDLGLVMAGAISAGAYTAGVIDFLFEALDAIHDKRSGADTQYLGAGLTGNNPVFDPGHDVRIKAMAGTSAGAMVTAIVATVLGARVPPVNPDSKLATATGNPLYDAWVNQIHYDRLLDMSDLASGGSLHSVLDGTVLDAIVKDSLAYARRTDYARPYVYDKLPIYLCVGNLRGVRYSLSLDSEPDAGTDHHMSMHADHVGFCFQPRAGGSDVRGLRTLVPGGDEAPWKAIGDAALASGAFPVGLPSRALSRQFLDYVNRPWFDPGRLLDPERRKDKDGNAADPVDLPTSWRSRAGEEIDLPPLDKDAKFPAGTYEFVNVDGGVFNNEPLELCRVALSAGERNPRDAAEATKSVLLIDPFPNLFALDTEYNPVKERKILRVLARLAGAYTSQSRFKPSELALARDPHVASRAAIMPVRYEGDNKKPEKYAIACGALGGFGGFLSKEFRHHDFMLGRRNCQRFLTHHLALPADDNAGVVNKLFSAWPRDAELRTPFEFRKKYSPETGGPEVEIIHLPVIPLLGKLGNPDYTRMPPWPVTPGDLRMTDLKSRVLARADAVKQALIRELEPAFIFRTGINAIWWQKKTEWIDRFVIGPVAKDLEDRGHRVRTG